MQTRRTWLLLLTAMIFPALGYSQTNCVAPALSDQKIEDIVNKERETRKDLPAAFANQKTTVRRQGCHYVYIEFGIPATPEGSHIFKLNQYGVIVDAQPGNPKCPDRVFTEGELAEIIRNERAKRSDLPPPFPKFTTSVNRLRCLYMYFEYAVPAARGNHQVFMIDPLGELMEVQRPDPY